jgi:hypothetical protein
LAEPSKAELRQLLAGLTSENFAVRERTQAALARYAREFPEVVKEGLAEDYAKAFHDPEQRYRLAEVLFDAVVEEMGHRGFLGIIMYERSTEIEGRRRPSILVREVGEGSAAARAGLRPGDQILQVDDLQFVPNARVQGQFRAPATASLSQNMERFKAYIEKKKKGGEVNLKVARESGGISQMLDVKVELGRRPRELMEPAERLEEDRFFEQWLNGAIEKRGAAQPAE